MPLLATCSCGKTFRAKDHHAGQRARCPACGGTFQVPLVDHPLEVAAAPEPESGATQASRFSDEAIPAEGNPAAQFDLSIPVINKRADSWAGDWAPRTAVLGALTLYIVAFFLPAIEGGSRTGNGQWQSNGNVHSGMQAFVLALFPGIFIPPIALSWFANPLFLVGAVLAWLRQWLAAALAALSGSALAILGGVSMVCLATFRVQCDKQVSETRFEPREGYYAWLTAMLLLGLVCLAWSRLAPPPPVKVGKPPTLLAFLIALAVALLLVALFFVMGLSVDAVED